ncbi:MAG: flagellar motor switch protein FliN [Armatimonadetes bacterium]|nr:flagellar motor switch protein FliN [Armatimonadota bacterium]
MSDEVLSQEEIEALMGGGGGAAGEAPAAPEAEQAASSPEAEMAAVAQAASAPTITMSSEPDTSVRPAEFSPLSQAIDSSPRYGVDLILDVQLQVAVELGRATLHVREILGLGPGTVVELDKHAGEPVEVVINNKLVARGEVVLIDENFGVRITEIVTKQERDVNAKAA